MRLSFRKDAHMKQALLITGMLTFCSCAVAQQAPRPVVPASAARAELWLSHLEKLDRERLLSEGVPEHYHYLYSLNVERVDKKIRKAFTRLNSRTPARLHTMESATPKSLASIRLRSLCTN